MKSKQSIVFITINILVAILGFIRSFAFMKFFDFHELGIITLIITAASLIGFFQIGLINGGYRIIALQNADLRKKTNDVIFSFFALLSVAIFIISCLGYLLNFFSNWLILIVISVLGISLLLSNWLTNSLIGGGEFKRLNIANAISGSISLICLVFAYYFGLYGALASLLIQPILFILMVFITNSKELPSRFDFDLKHIKYILSFGFIPFLSGIFFLLYMQIERWNINAFLGPEALGKMYLFFLTVTLWVLVPTSVSSLFFPKAIKFYAENDQVNFNKIIKLNSIIIFTYCVGVSILILVLFQPVVGFIFPKHQPYVYLVLLALPGLILRTMADPLSLFFTSIVRLKPILWSEIMAITTYIMCVCVLFLSNAFSLRNFVLCFNMYMLSKFIYLITDFARFKFIQQKV